MKTEKISTGTGIIVAGIFIAAAIFFSRGGTAPQVASTTTKITVPTYAVKAEASGDHYIGKANAPIVITEYSDLECPFCKQAHPTVHKVLEAYKDEVGVEYVHFPLSIHPKAQKEAEAAECVYKLGGNVAFWSFIDTIFAITPANNGLDAALLPEVAKKVGVNEKQFMTCLDSGEMADKVAIDQARGTANGVKGTPQFVITSRATGKSITIPGAIPFEQFKLKIEEVLSGGGQIAQ
jgi:protein-disulfide isomerase